jgi:hypothetical protein
MVLRQRPWLLLLVLGFLLGAEAGTAWCAQEDEPGDEKEERKANQRANARSQGAPPPPPPVVFRSEPEVILIPKTRVYYVPDQKYDLFRYGRHWYINNGGHWYRARAYAGPFTSLSFERVPATIVRLPEKYRRQPLVPARRAKDRD